MIRKTLTPSSKKLNRRVYKLTDSALRGAKQSEAAYKISDGGGLYCEITPTGSKLWRINYRFNGKQRTLYLPPYPDMSLQNARDALREAKRNIAKGIDPMGAKKRKKENIAKKKAEEEQLKTTFRRVAEDWLVYYARRVTPKQIEKIARHLELYLYPVFGGITPAMKLAQA